MNYMYSSVSLFQVYNEMTALAMEDGCMIHIREEVIIGPLYLGTHGQVAMSIAVATGTHTPSQQCINPSGVWRSRTPNLHFILD